MAFQYIIGLPQTGKTAICLRELTQCNANAFFIVPEQSSLNYEKAVVRIAQSTTAQVVSFQRLAFRLLSATGAPQGIALDEVGKQLLIRKILSSLAPKLVLYARAAAKQGFVAELASLFGEFYQYGVRPENLEDLSQKPHNSSVRQAAKFHDLALIFDAYDKTIRGRYFTLETALDIAPQRVENYAPLNNAYVWVDGFHTFNAQERNVLEQIIKIAKFVKVTSTIDYAANTYTNLAPTDFFYECKRTINSLTAIAAKCGVKLEQPIYLPVDKPDTCLGMFRSMFYKSMNRAQYPETNDIGVTKATDREEEVEHTARAIIRTLREKRLRYRDIAVQTGDLPGYERIIRRVFSEYDIPVFIDSRKDILYHPLTELIRASVDVAVRNFSYESVFRFLRTGLTGIARRDVDMLENYVLAHGIKGWQWKRPWNNNGVETLRRRVYDILSPMEKKEQSVKEFAQAVYGLLNKLNVTGTLTFWTEQDNTREHSQVWGSINSVFDKMVEILGEEVITVRDFNAILESGLAGADMGLIPPSADSVVATDLTRSRLHSIQSLFILGANDGLLPKPAPDRSILSEEDRTFMASRGAEIPGGGFKHSLEERFLAYCALSRPKSSLCISYSLSADGKPLRPSRVVTDILTVFPNLSEDSAKPDMTLARAMLGKMGPTIHNHMQGDSMSNIDKDVLGQLRQNATTRAATARMINAASYFTSERRLGNAVTRRLYGKELVTSVSRLERYAQCPFAYFLNYDLRLRERGQFNVTGLDLGNLYHDVLEMFSKKLEQEGGEWRHLNEETIDRLTDACVDELSEGLPVFVSTKRLSYMLRRVRRVCKRSVWALSEHIKAGRFEPVSAEMSFEGPLKNIDIRINGNRKLTLTGRIDRVDIYEANGRRYVKIIDYKSGNVKFNLYDVYLGVQLQLLLYIHTLVEHGQELFDAQTSFLPGGVFYFNINDPLVDEVKVDEMLHKTLLKSFKMSGMLLNDMDVINALHVGLAGHSDIYPVQVTSNGVSKKSSALDSDKFTELQQFVQQKIVDTCNEIVSGRIDVKPYKKTACEYCLYVAVCGVQILKS